jgi:hypothetical protein
MLSQSFFFILYDISCTKKFDVEIADGGWTGEREKEKKSNMKKGVGKGQTNSERQTLS